MNLMSDDAAIELLEDLVRAASPSGCERAASELLVDRMNALGFRAFVDEVGNAVGEIGSGDPHVVLLGHIDTVPGDIPVRRENGLLHGRGSVDAKGPLATFVMAAARAAMSGTPGRVTVIGCVEEEAPSSRGARFVAQQSAPDACIVGEPSGGNGITLGYKGYVRARFECADDTGHGAHDRTSVAARACLLGAAIEQEAATFNAERTTAWNRLLTNISSVQTSNDGVEERAVLDVALRLPPDLSPGSAFARLEALAPGWTLERLGFVPAWTGDRRSPLHRSLHRAIVAGGQRPRYVRKTGTADLNIVAPAWGCPSLAYGPGDASLDHTPHEHIVLDEYTASITVLEQTLANFAKTLAAAS